MTAPRIAIIGASARAAAMSARRAGFQAITADLFADEDLFRIAQATRVADYPHALADWLAKVEADGWLYTGALENHPRLVDRLSRLGTLWGNMGQVLRRVRSPWHLARVLAGAGLLFPETRRDAPPRGNWLAKNCRGSSGSGVCEWRQNDQPIAGRVWQQRVEGLACAAVFVASDSDAHLLGLSRQLVGASWSGARAFQYCGSIGPWPVEPGVVVELQRIGRVLAREFRLRGLFGVDLILDHDRLWTIEVNPRYSASVEIIERATGVPAIAAHVAACRGEPVQLPAAAAAESVHGKAIVFADRAVTISREFTAWALAESQKGSWPAVADIPAAGTRIDAGQPVVTVFATARDADDVEPLLGRRVAEVRRRLRGELQQTRVCDN